MEKVCLKKGVQAGQRGIIFRSIHSLELIQSPLESLMEDNGKFHLSWKLELGALFDVTPDQTAYELMHSRSWDSNMMMPR